jgi:hypothetical protein
VPDPDTKAKRARQPRAPETSRRSIQDSLLVAAGATLAIPNGVRLIIDNGFASPGGEMGQ